MLRGRKEKVVHWEEIRKDFETLAAEDPEEGVEDLDNRVLCEDESCIGVVGEDGRCRQCGRAQSRREAAGEAAPEEDVAEEEAESEEEEAWEEDQEEEEPETFDADVADRILCSDGSCIGLVGEDGYCKTCGLKYKPEGYGDDEPGVYREDDELGGENE